MVRFVGVENMVRWVRSIGVEQIVADMVDYLEADFTRWDQFDKTPRVASHSPYGVIELMPTSDRQTYSFKYVNGHPINTKIGRQTVTAFGVLADVASGYPLFLSEMTLLTALRTAATSVMAAKLLAPPNASVLSLIGTGAQAEFQALGFRSVLGMLTLRVFDTDPQAVQKLRTNIEPLGFDIVDAATVEDAIAGAHVITTCTADKTKATILRDDMVASSVHINAIGGDCPGKTELDAALLMRSNIFAEYLPQTRIEGELQQLDPKWPATELWEVLTGASPGRTSGDQITIFDSVGFAIEDFSALRYLSDSVADTDFFETIDLIAEPSDPKNLFGLLD